MIRILLKSIMLSIFLFPIHANSAIIQTITHNYGSDIGRIDPGGNDSLSFNYVLVSDQSASRFNDTFNFDSLSFQSINSFTLALTFSNTNDKYLGFIPEDWRVRPGESSTLIQLGR
jgi:hypothetical protein